jgi:hypothetical protein
MGKSHIKIQINVHTPEQWTRINYATFMQGHMNNKLLAQVGNPKK